MPFYFVKPENISATNFTVDGSEAGHLARVLRKQIGDKIQVFDGSGKVYSGKIQEISAEKITCKIISCENAPARKVNLKLYQAVLKGDKFDWLVEKAVELGVSSIYPLICERSILKDIGTAKIERWKRIALSAEKQSKQANGIEVSDPIDFVKAISNINSGVFSIIPWESEEGNSIELVLANIEHSSPVSINVFIGPEGGFTHKEIDIAKSFGITPVTLGKNILRSETAGLLTSTLVLNHFGAYNGK
ncbi:MAG: 16S rRNA (uracil(1498)-N(3))-methyltransferase [Endomicrobiales bacterium]|nr:16S rRNA (uracil(1498)-N(3))-methyltransferase [Endomicrobiales bacterium]